MKKRKWLPENVTEYFDRHGRARYRFRKSGLPEYHFKSAPGTEEFRVEYAACSAAAPRLKSIKSRAAPGTFRDLVDRYYSSPKWKSLDPSTQRTYRGIIERFCEKHGSKPVALATTGHLDIILGKMASTPAAANSLRKVLNRLFKYAVKIGMRADNPAALTDGFKKGKGFHTWTEEEIEQFREKHALGTRARLAMELLLNTSARRCDVAALTRSQLRKGKFHIQHAKGCEATVVPALPTTLAAIEAMPVAGIGHFLVTEFGKAFSAPGFGNWFRDRCNEAGLSQCSAHGLRKAMSRRLAESGATDAQGRSVTGQKKNETFAYYAEKADREALADKALANLETHFLANPKNL